jgi:WD40 repeat protein
VNRHPGISGRNGVGTAMMGILLLVLLACGPPSTARDRPAAPPRLVGAILGGGQPFGSGLSAYELPELDGREFNLPQAQYGGQIHWGAHWEAGGTALAFVALRGNTSGLFRLSLDGPPEPIGSPLRFVSGFSVHDHHVLATTCEGGQQGRLVIIDLESASDWRAVGRSCTGSFSPDGERVAFLRGRWEVWERPVDRGPARRMIDLAMFPEVRSAPGSNLGASSVLWGRGGLAVQIGEPGGFDRSSRSSVVVVRNDGEVVPVPLTPQSIDLPLSGWQPGGGLLALITRPSSGGSLIRLFDPSSGEVRVAAADSQFFGHVVWSPDGQALAANTSTNALLFFDAEGGWIRRAGIGVGVFDWTER